MSIVAQDKKVVWHPFTQHKTAEAPLAIERASGARLYTQDGQTIIDAVSSWWVTLHGHCHPYIVERVQKQLATLEQVIFAGCTHEPAVSLAQRIIAHLPKDFGKAFYSDNGSTAVEVAVKIALQYFHNRGRAPTQLIVLRGGYHGDTFGSMSLSERSTFTAPFQPLLFDVSYIDAPLPGHPKGQSVKQLKNCLARNPKATAALLYEPIVQGVAGMLVQDHRELDALLGFCREAGVLCIADEVMTGFGRTGRLFASDFLSNKPDIICLSKGITGGMLPLGMTVVQNRIFEAFLSADDPASTFFHGHSYCANPVACTAGLASLDLLEGEESEKARTRIAKSHMSFVEEIAGDQSLRKCFCDVRVQGTILALEWDTGASTGYFNALRDQLYAFFLSRKVLLRPLGNVSYLLPPYCISNEELNVVYQAIKDFATQQRCGNAQTTAKDHCQS